MNELDSINTSRHSMQRGSTIIVLTFSRAMSAQCILEVSFLLSSALKVQPLVSHYREDLNKVAGGAESEFTTDVNLGL